MTDNPIERYKAQDDYSPDDWIEHNRTGKKPEREEYVNAKREALKAAGFEDDNPGPPEDMNEWTAQDHYHRLQGGNR